jgi:uncharacterized cofD-like protein
MIVIGPGSLYTSVLPNLLVPDIVKAIRTSRAFKVFVCNVAHQSGETDGYDCGQHLAAIERHVGPGFVDLVIANDCQAEIKDSKVTLVDLSWDHSMMTQLYTTDLIDMERPSRHDAKKLASALIALLEERTGPLDLPHADQSNANSGLN